MMNDILERYFAIFIKIRFMRDWKLLLELIDGAVITIMQSHNLRL